MSKAWTGRRGLAWTLAGLTFVAALTIVPAPARAGDLDTAKKKLEDVKSDLAGQRWNSIDDDMKAVEEFLDGVPDADKAPILKELATIRAQAEPQIKAAKGKAITDTVTRYIDGAASEVQAVPERAISDLQEATTRLNTDEARKYVDPATAKALQGRIAGIQAMAMKGTKKRVMDYVGPVLKELEAKVAADPFKGKDQNEAYRIGQSLESDVKRVRGQIDPLPKNDPDVVAINARLAAIEQKIDASAGDAEKSEKVAFVARSWKDTKDYFTGWDKEAAGPTWDQFSKTSSQEMSALLMPKTVEAISRITYWLDREDIKSAKDKYGSDPTLKATLDDAAKTLDTAAGKLSGAFNKLLDEGEKLPVPSDDFSRRPPQTLADDAGRWFKGTKYLDANVARAKALHDRWEGTVAGAAKASEELYNKFVQQANAAWPKLSGKLKATDGFTPDKLASFKGKTIHINANNRLGWDYSPGNYDFAREINGMAVAAQFNPRVRGAIDEIRKKTGKGLGEEGEWDLYAVIEGPGKIQERTATTGQITVNGSNAGTYREEGHKEVDCAVAKIIALHAGPLAVGPDGMVTETGAIVPVPGVADDDESGGFLGTLFRFVIHLFELLICVLAAGAVIVKSRAKAPVLAGAAGENETLASSGGVINYAGTLAPAGDAISYAGLGFAVLGLLWLLSHGILGDLLPAGALIIAGLFVAGDLLRSRSILPASTAEQLRPLGIPIAAAVAFFALLHLFLYNWWIF